MIIRGLSGKYVWSLYVCVAQPVRITIMLLKIDLMLKAGNPSRLKLLFESLIAYCEPNPTRSPAIINLTGEVLIV